MSKTIFSLVIVWATAWVSVWFGNWVQLNPTIKYWDARAYEWFQNIPRTKLIESIVWPFNFDFLSWSGSKPSFIYFLVGGFLIYMGTRQRKQLVKAIITLVLASVFIVWITNIDWTYIHRKRPFLVLPSQVTQFEWNSWKDWSTYPSGHVRETTLYSTVIAGFVPGASVGMGVFVIFVGLSRLYVGAHYPTDVMAAIVIGWLAAQSALRIVKSVSQNSKRQPGRSQEVASQNIGRPMMTEIDTGKTYQNDKSQETSYKKQFKNGRTKTQRKIDEKTKKSRV